MNSITPSTYIISDTHFLHKKIIEYGRPTDYEEQIITNWNNLLKKEDRILCLGDLTLGNFEETEKIVKNLNGEKYLIKGNHDRHSATWYSKLGFEVIEPIFKLRRTKDNKEYGVIFSHEPVNISQPNFFNFHGHLHGANHHEGGKTNHHFDLSCECTNYSPILLSTLYEQVEARLSS